MYKDLKHVKLGNMDLYNGDNMELLRQTPDKFYDCAITDPPYGISVNSMNMGGRKTQRPNEKTWDNEIPSEEYFKELFRVSKNQIIWGGNYFPLPVHKCFVIWDKGETMYGRDFAECEMAWCSYNKPAKIFKLSPNQLDRIHPTQKPVPLYEYLIKTFLKPNDKILDTHLGSGSIAIAAHNLGFNLTAIELDEEYFNKAMTRIENVAKFKTSKDLF